jgi:hypothetical protein
VRRTSRAIVASPTTTTSVDVIGGQSTAPPANAAVAVAVAREDAGRAMSGSPASGTTDRSGSRRRPRSRSCSGRPATLRRRRRPCRAALPT